MKNWKLYVAAVLTGICGTYFVSNQPEAKDIQEELAGKVLRFHVLANSDSEEDQQLKLKVKEEVVAYLDTYFAGEELTLEKSKEIVKEQEEEITALAEQIIWEQGYDYSVTTELATEYFPVKSYGDITLPAGEYQAFRIKIGDACGKNWWCILYPPLCFVDASYGYVPDESKNLLQNVLDRDCYEAVTAGGNSEQVEVRFKLWDNIVKLFS